MNPDVKAWIYRWGGLALFGVLAFLAGALTAAVLLLAAVQV